MAPERDEEKEPPLSLPQPSALDLRGRQSVRATFRLSGECIEAISIVAIHLGIQQKSLFDHLAEDVEFLETVGRELSNTKLPVQDRVQKTFVISRRSLMSLDHISRRHNAPRDALVEFSVHRLLPLIRRERKRHASRKEMFAALTDHMEQGRRLLEMLRDSLGKEDPLANRFEAVMSLYRNTYQQLDAFMERGRLIEDFDPEELEKKRVR
jgi:hypothetical protein